jgi:hypothetical protein
MQQFNGTPPHAAVQWHTTSCSSAMAHHLMQQFNGTPPHAAVQWHATSCSNGTPPHAAVQWHTTACSITKMSTELQYWDINKWSRSQLVL